MKLCRFELRADPGTVRSGIYHDGRFYETDGERAIGIHDPGAVHLLTPTGQPPAVRLFEARVLDDGSLGLSYGYANPHRLQGTTSDIDTSGADGEVGLEVRVAALMQSAPQGTLPVDAAPCVLGYALLVQVVDLDERERLSAQGLDPAPSREFGAWFGPFVATPEDLLEARTGSDPTRYVFAAEVQVNGQSVAKSTYDPGMSTGELVAYATTKAPMDPGEVLAWPAWDMPPFDSTSLERGLAPTDRVTVTVEPLGTVAGTLV